MGNFGYQLPEAVRGDVGGTSINVIRTGIANEDIAFGDILELTYRTETQVDQFGTKPIVSIYRDLLDIGMPILGVALYRPESSNGHKTQYKYIAGSQVSYMTSGDVYMQATNGSYCFAGDPAYLAFNGGKWYVTDQITPRRFGTFAETKIATADNSVLVTLNLQLPLNWGV